MERYSEKIDDYLSGMLSSKQESNFLLEVEGNKALQKELHFQEELRETINDEGLMKLRNTLNQKRTETKKIPFYVSFYPKGGKNFLFSAAATLALLIVSGLLYIFLNGQVLAPDQIAQKYYVPANAIQNLRSVEQTDIMGTKEAFTFYNNGQYERSLKLFMMVDNKVVSNFYSGICYFELNDFSNAKKSFEFVMIDSHNLFVDQAQWYLALTYLKMKEIEKAKVILNLIIRSEGPYLSKSNEILKKLK